MPRTTGFNVRRYTRGTFEVAQALFPGPPSIAGLRQLDGRSLSPRYHTSQRARLARSDRTKDLFPPVLTRSVMWRLGSSAVDKELRLQFLEFY